MAQKAAKKKFFEVKVPLTASKAYIFGSSPEALNDSVIRLDLTRSLRGKSIELKARVKNNNGELEAEIIGLQIFPYYIRRAVRKGTDYVEDSFEEECKDARLRIKPF